LNIARTVLTILLLVNLAFAQADGPSGGIPNEFSIFTGRVLPNGVDGATEIFSISGLRYSRAFSDKGHGFWEVGANFGNSAGVEWKAGSASLRMDVPIETLVGFTYIGADFTQYTGVGVAEQSKGGAHVGGGMMTNIGGATSLRFDMKLTSKPGTFLFFGLGLSWAF
jgi:hypothetical protein